MENNYHIAVITIKVKKECIDDFIAITQKNVQCSRKEAGIVSFDLFRKKESLDEFMLIEVYKTPEDQMKHRNTAHFFEFKEKVGSLLQEPYNVNNYAIVQD